MEIKDIEQIKRIGIIFFSDFIPNNREIAISNSQDLKWILQQMYVIIQLSKRNGVVFAIASTMNEVGPLLHQKMDFKFSSFASLKENVDVKIDAALKVMKCNGNATLASETKNESRRYLEYEIDFQN